MSRDQSYLSVRQWKINPTIVEDLPVALFNVLEAADKIGIDGRLNGDLALAPGPLDELQRPEHGRPGGLMRRLGVHLLQSDSLVLQQQFGIDQSLGVGEPGVDLLRHQAEDQDDREVDVSHDRSSQVASEVVLEVKIIAFKGLQI